MLEIIGKTNIDFLGKRKFLYLLSLMFCGLTVFAWIWRGEGRYDIDFVGGHEFVVKVAEGTDSDHLRSAIEKVGIENAVVQAYEAATHEFSIRAGGKAEDAKPLRDKVTAALNITGTGAQILQTDFIGPTAGNELKQKAVLAIALSLIGIVIYVTFRFEFAFACGAFVALLHDVIVATGIYLLAGHDLNMGAVAAALTVVGYSVNDTIVVFDKVREEIFKRKNYELIPLMNECVNLMLGRTLVTSGLTFFSALALYLFGGGAIADLSLYLVVGILTGTYSTVFIASPIVVAWHGFQSRRSESGKHTVASSRA